jgi:molecular chaperone GrpE
MSERRDPSAGKFPGPGKTSPDEPVGAPERPDAVAGATPNGSGPAPSATGGAEGEPERVVGEVVDEGPAQDSPADPDGVGEGVHETPAEDAPGDPDVVGELLLPDLAALLAERDEYLSALQRVKADFDNYRKRVLRLQEEQAARGARELVSKLLPVLDTLDLAEAHLVGTERDGDGPSHEAAALGQARAQLIDVLVREGLERVDQTEVAFDPSVHDAVAHAPAEGSDGSDTRIDEVLRSGYRWQGQVLRPAMVRVRG